jgi:hypothetical protein
VECLRLTGVHDFDETRGSSDLRSQYGRLFQFFLGLLFILVLGLSVVWMWAVLLTFRRHVLVSVFRMNKVECSRVYWFWSKSPRRRRVRSDARFGPILKGVFLRATEYT